MRILSIDAYNRVVNLSKEDEKEFFIQRPTNLDQF